MIDDSLCLPWRVVNGGFIYDADDRLVLQVYEQGWSLRPRSEEEVKKIAEMIVAVANSRKI